MKSKRPIPTEIQKAIWNDRKQLRAALCEQYSYFTHETEKASICSIRSTGLVANVAGTSVDDKLIEQLGVGQRGMICLHPVGSEPGVHSTKNGPFVLLAIKPAALPDEVTLDWSFPGFWSLVPMLESSGNAEWIFLEVVKRRGSVSALGGIAPEHLHVLCKRASDNEPGRWLALTDTQDEDIFVYSTAVQPPVVPDIPFE